MHLDVISGFTVLKEANKKIADRGPLWKSDNYKYWVAE